MTRLRNDPRFPELGSKEDGVGQYIHSLLLDRFWGAVETFYREQRREKKKEQGDRDAYKGRPRRKDYDHFDTIDCYAREGGKRYLHHNPATGKGVISGYKGLPTIHYKDNRIPEGGCVAFGLIWILGFC